MTVAEAERAFREMLPCETVTPSICTGKIYKFDRPFQITYEKGDSLLTSVFLTFKHSERAISTYSIERLKLSEV